jgi:FkbM family methyltransferase
MKPRRRKMEEVLWALGLHAPARRFHSATVGRQAERARARMKQFYRGLIDPGNLVFDIGANAGVLSATFASLGARVVALEPNADCVRHIQLSYGDTEIQVLQAAVGPTNGLVVFNVSDDSDVKSSVSNEWIAAAAKRDEDYRRIWTRQMVVPMVTLDTLISQFGLPEYIKIDVEGFEESVLAGLSTQPELLSFEFHVAFLPAAMHCLDMGLFATESTFNFVCDAEWGYLAEFKEKTWLDKDGMKEALTKLEGSDSQGDIFVKAPRRA